MDLASHLKGFPQGHEQMCSFIQAVGWRDFEVMQGLNSKNKVLPALPALTFMWFGLV